MLFVGQWKEHPVYKNLLHKLEDQLLETWLCVNNCVILGLLNESRMQ